MKRSLTLTGAGLAAAGLVLALVPTLSASALEFDYPCAQMGRSVTILNTPTPTCTLLYTSGPSSIVLPSDGPRLVYGVVNMTGSSVPTTFTDQNGMVYPLNPTEGKRWLSVGPTRASQTIVKAEIVNKKIGKTFPYLFITDDAITDRFSGKSFIGKTNNAKGSKSAISIWTRIDWASGLSDNGGLHGVIANYKQNILDAGQCKPAMTKQHADMVKQRFGQKGKLELSWNPGLTKSQGGSSLIMNTETSAVFARPAPTALELTQRVWRPGKINFTLVGSNAGLMKILVYDVRGGSAVTKCSLKP